MWIPMWNSQHCSVRRPQEVFLAWPAWKLVSGVVATEGGGWILHCYDLMKLWKIYGLMGGDINWVLSRKRQITTTSSMACVTKRLWMFQSRCKQTYLPDVSKYIIRVFLWYQVVKILQDIKLSVSIFKKKKKHQRHHPSAPSAPASSRGCPFWNIPERWPCRDSHPLHCSSPSPGDWMRQSGWSMMVNDG